MEAVAIAQLKADFSRILSRIEQTGEGVIVEYGRLHKKSCRSIALLIKIRRTGRASIWHFGVRFLKFRLGKTGQAG